MPITLIALQEASRRFTKSFSASEARTIGAKSAFLCHSHKDAEFAKGFINMLNESGWKIYVDWADTEMPETPDRETAEKIQKRIRELDFFLFLATPHSVASRWCPWEIGYANGVKHIDSLIVVPTIDSTGRHFGNEYLQMYRHIDLADTRRLGVRPPGAKTGGTLLENIK